MSTKAQIRASTKYLNKTYDRSTVCLKKEHSALLKSHLSARSESANSFFNRAAALQVAVDVGAVSVVGEVPPLVGDCEGEGENV